MTRAHEHMLIRLVLGGDDAAATELVRAHQGPLFAFLVRLSGRRDLAEDITQEAFVRAIQHLHRFDFEHRFSTWLFTIARRVYWNIMEKHAPIAVGDALEGLHQGELERQNGRHGAWGQAAPQVAQGLELQEERSREAKVLQAALLELSPVQREILVLFHQQGWPITLLATTLGMPEGTVKSHLHRARVRLRELMTGTPSTQATFDPHNLLAKLPQTAQSPPNMNEHDTQGPFHLHPPLQQESTNSFTTKTPSPDATTRPSNTPGRDQR